MPPIIPQLGQIFCLPPAEWDFPAMIAVPTMKPSGRLIGHDAFPVASVDPFARSMILVCAQYYRKAGLVLQSLSHIFRAGIGTTRLGVYRVGTQGHGVRLHLGELCRHSQVCRLASSGAFAFDKGNHL
jgi:hypothetical protein